MGSAIWPASAAGAGSSWYATESAFHVATVSQLTESVPVQCGITPVGESFGTGVGDAGTEGGGIYATGTNWVQLGRPAIWQNIKTSKWAVSFQAKLPTPTTAKAAYLGVILAGGANYISIQSAFATSTTNFVVEATNGVVTTGTPITTTIPWNASVNTWCMTGDGTTLKVFLNAVQVASLLMTATNFPTAAMSPAFYASASYPGMSVYKCLYSYVGP